MQVGVLGCGVGGIEELRRQLDDSTVAWALLRFQVGGGTFVRTKMVLIHLNGINTPVIQRGLLNARSQEVLRQLGEVNASLQVASGKELTVDYLCERLLPVFSTDHMEYSLQGLKTEYDKMVKASQQRAEAPLQETRETEGVLPPPLPTLEPPTARAVHGASDVTLQEAMQEVASEEGFFNWVLIDPSRLCLYKAGQGGFDELQEHLASERVLFGVLRMTFGGSLCNDTGRTIHGLTKHVLVHWVGPGVSVMRRGLDSARYGQVAHLVGRYCAVAFRKEVHCAADLRLEMIIHELQRLTVVDSTSGGSGQAASRISVEEYNIAMAEESRHRDSRLQRLRPKPQAEPRETRCLEAATPRAEPVTPTQTHEEPTQPAPALPDLSTALRAVRDPTGRFDWVIFGWPAASLRLPPSPCRASWA